MVSNKNNLQKPELNWPCRQVPFQVIGGKSYQFKLKSHVSLQEQQKLIAISPDYNSGRIRSSWSFIIKEWHVYTFVNLTQYLLVGNDEVSFFEEDYKPGSTDYFDPPTPPQA